MIHRARALAVLTGLAVAFPVAAQEAAARNKAQCKAAQAELRAAKRAHDVQAMRKAKRKVAKYCGA